LSPIDFSSSRHLASSAAYGTPVAGLFQSSTWIHSLDSEAALC